MLDSTGRQADGLSQVAPRARADDLLVSEVDDELVIYDLKRHRAHSLNGPAAAVWRACDGQTPVAALAARVQPGVPAPAAEEAVWLALGQLNRARLLAESSGPLAPATRYSRRDLVTRIGAGLLGGAVVLPVVTSIVAPEAVAAASCKAEGASCNNQQLCCPGLTCRTEGAQRRCRR